MYMSTVHCPHRKIGMKDVWPSYLHLLENYVLYVKTQLSVYLLENLILNGTFS
jgi:hypothetical protein